MGLIAIISFIIIIVVSITSAPKRRKFKLEIENALANINKELEKSPENVALILQKAGAISHLEGFEKSYKFLDDAIQKNPNSGQLYYYRGWFLTQADNGLPKQGYFYYAKAIELGGLDEDELTYAYSMRGQIGHNHNVIGAKADLFKAKERGSASAINYIKKWRLKE